ncbi:MAG TPA: hypothetical protein VM491_05740, partial [Burkholderiaceae bacterium]|nr:hypothetical protein [Burkholderiaceae bacterium]
MDQTLKVTALFAVGMALPYAGNAQEMTDRATCHLAGPPAMEPVGQDAMMQAVTYTCRVEGGPLEGAVMTGNAIYRYKQGTGEWLANHGVIRRHDGLMVYRGQEGNVKLQMKEGQITGWTGTGKNTVPAAAGTVF